MRSAWRPAHSANRTKNGATNPVSRWLPRPRPTSSPPRARSRSRLLVGPDEGAVDEQRHQREVERVDLGDEGGRPDRGDGPGRERRQRREHRADAEPRPDRRELTERDRDAHGRQQVGAPRDGADRDQLEQPGEQDVGRVAGRDGRPRGRGARVCISPQSSNAAPGISVTTYTPSATGPRWPARHRRTAGPGAVGSRGHLAKGSDGGGSGPFRAGDVRPFRGGVAPPPLLDGAPRDVEQRHATMPGGSPRRPRRRRPPMGPRAAAQRDPEPAVGRRVGDPRGHVDGPSEHVAVALDERPARDARVPGRQAGGQGGEDLRRRVDGVVEASSNLMSTPSPSSLTTRPPRCRRCRSRSSPSRSATAAAASSPRSSVSRVKPVEVDERDRRRGVDPLREEARLVDDPLALDDAVLVDRPAQVTAGQPRESGIALRTANRAHGRSWRSNSSSSGRPSSPPPSRPPPRRRSRAPRRRRAVRPRRTSGSRGPRGRSGPSRRRPRGRRRSSPRRRP